MFANSRLNICRLGLFLIWVALLNTSCSVFGNDPRPGEGVHCTDTLTYEGKPLYASSASLPTPEFQLGKTFDSATSARLDSAFTEAMRLTQAKVMSAAVFTTMGKWAVTRAADGSPQKARLYWASVGKLMTATVILQLVEEGKLALSDPISRWLPDFPNATVITIDHLLQHTSGVFSSNEDESVRKAHRYFTPDEDIALSAKHGALFCPGQWWRYSNTGYVILGKIIESIDGRPYHEAVNARLFASLSLPTLQALAPQQDPGDLAPLAPSDSAEKPMEPNWGYAAGCVVGSAEDMALFLHALLTGKLLHGSSIALMFSRLYPMFDEPTFYGRGVMLYNLPVDSGTSMTWVGHSGGSPGIKSIVLYSPKDGAFAAVALTGDGSAPASANLLLKQLQLSH
jgi:D-alanyl-D-alanine carboxypeptidase